MNATVVNANCTGRSFLKDLIADLLLIAENVERQCLGLVVDDRDGIIDIPIGDDGQDGSENFFCHYACMAWHLCEDHGMNKTRALIDLASEFELCSMMKRILQQIIEPEKMFFIHDPAIAFRTFK